MQLSVTQAKAAMLLHKNGSALTVAQLEQLLRDVSVTFAQITYCTKVQLAAAHKAQDITKVTTANVVLASSLRAQTQLYARAVRKSAARIVDNDAQAVENFVAQSNYFEHTGTHCIVQHKQHADKFYLFAIYNNAASVYMHNNAVVSKQNVATYCTPSAAKQLLEASNVVHNVTNNIDHTVRVRTIALSNIVSIRARKQFLSV